MAAASGAAAAAEVPADVQAAYVAQYLAEVERIRSMAAAAGGDDTKHRVKGVSCSFFVKALRLKASCPHTQCSHLILCYIAQGKSLMEMPIVTMCRMYVPTDEKALDQNSKRVKTEGGWQTLSEDAPEPASDTRTAAAVGAASADVDEDHDWEDAAQTTAGGDGEPGGDDDGFDWEET